MPTFESEDLKIFLDSNHDRSVGIFKEGLCLWSYSHSSHFQIYPMSGLEGIINTYCSFNPILNPPITRIFDGEIRKSKQSKLHPEISDQELEKLCSLEILEEIKCFGLIYYDDRDQKEIVK